jgi:hypothetical protein
VFLKSFNSDLVSLSFLEPSFICNSAIDAAFLSLLQASFSLFLSMQQVGAYVGTQQASLRQQARKHAGSVEWGAGILKLTKLVWFSLKPVWFGFENRLSFDKNRN